MIGTLLDELPQGRTKKKKRKRKARRQRQRTFMLDGRLTRGVWKRDKNKPDLERDAMRAVFLV